MAEDQTDTIVSAERVKKAEKLWNRDFLLLWQGGLVSMMGDLLYEIALGFWILAVTGSTGMMGTLMAVSLIPRIIMAPVAGVVADRYNRKLILVFMDLIRGICVTLVGVAALRGILEIWMVFSAGVVLGLCAGFFDPAAGALFPDLVPRDQLERGNSAFALIHSGSRIAGNSIGGFLYVTLGAPLMFLLNGISYIFSSASEVFIRNPRREHAVIKQPFIEDLKEGYRYVWDQKGIRVLMIVGAILNFFASAGIVLLLPLFQQEEMLGPARYGIFMAVSAVGSLLGMLLVSVRKIAPEKRFRWFVGSLLLFTMLYAILPLIRIYPVMLALGLVCSMFNMVVNILLQTIMQLTVDPDKRGKVFSLLSMLLSGMMPIAMAMGGWLGEFLPIPLVISGCMVLCSIPGLFLLPNRDFRTFISYDPAGGLQSYPE